MDPEGSAGVLGLLENDVIVAVNGHVTGSFDRAMRMMADPARPLYVTIRRPQQLLNSPLHFTLEDEIPKASRIISCITSTPEHVRLPFPQLFLNP